MLRILCRSAYNIKKDLWIQSLQKCSTLTENNVEKNTENYIIYEPFILHVINKCSTPVLKKYIKAKYAEAIILSRVENGYYTSLKDVLLRTQMNSDIFKEFCYSIVNNRLKEKMKVTPKIKKEIKPNTILGIHVGETALCWSLLSHDFKVLDWDCITWRNNNLDKFHIYDTISIASSFVSQLPPSDTYVMEDFCSVFKRVHHIFNLYLSIASCIKLIISQRQNNLITLGNDLYMLDPSMAVNLFRLKLGNEVLATRYVMDMVLNDMKLNNEKLYQVHMDDTLKSKYIKLDDIEKEQINWSFLKAMTFAYCTR